MNVIVKATCVLHNFLRRRDGASSDSLPYMEHDDVDVEQDGIVTQGTWRRESPGALRCPGRLGTNNAARQAMELRERFAEHFLSPEGALPWQAGVVRRGERGAHE